ncbi:MAG TPA: hypothetical protein PKK48_05595 [Phycisphaerae bacterium]|nr:hypothetical protein [Phycisphaerae bacterium]
MRSSISNSELRRPDMNYARLWLLAAVMTLAILGSCDVLIRMYGVTPSLVDDMKLWEYTRDGMLTGTASANQVIFIGTSRANLGIDPGIFEKETGCDVLKLGIAGSEAWPLLRDIAENTDFRGTIFYDFRADACSRNDIAQITEKYIREYYKNYSNLGKYDKILNEKIAIFFQSSLAIVDIAPENLNRIFLPEKARADNYVVIGKDRATKAYYRTKLTAKGIAKNRKKRIREAREACAGKCHDDSMWQCRIREIGKWVKLVQDRGGRVVLVRFPTSGEHWELDSAAYPREKYWNKIAGLTGAVTIHFKDIQGFESVDCPDTSHLNYDDAEKFTEYLAKWYDINIGVKRK